MSEEEREDDYSYRKPRDCILYVAYLSKAVTWHILKETFSKFGKVTKVYLAPDPFGYAIVIFENITSAREARRALHRQELCGKKIEVQVYRPKCRKCGILGHKEKDCYGRTTPLSLSSCESLKPENCSPVRNHGSGRESTTSDSEISSQKGRNFVHPREISPRRGRSRVDSKENRSKRNRRLTEIQGAQCQGKVPEFHVPVYTRCSRSAQNSRILTKTQETQLHYKEVIHEFQPPVYTHCSRSGQNSRILTEIQRGHGKEVIHEFQPPMFTHCSRSEQSSRILTNVKRAQGRDKEIIHEFQPSMYTRCSRSGQNSRSFVRYGPQQRQFCGYHHSDMFNLGVNSRNDYSACSSSHHHDSFYNLSCHCSCHQSKSCGSYQGQPYSHKDYISSSNSASCSYLMPSSKRGSSYQEQPYMYKSHISSSNLASSSYLMPSYSLQNKKKPKAKAKAPKEDSSESDEIEFIDSTKVSKGSKKAVQKYQKASESDEIEFIDSSKVLDFRAQRIIRVDERINIEDDLTKMALMQEMFGDHKDEILQIEKELGTYCDDLYDEVKPPLFPVLPARL